MAHSIPEKFLKHGRDNVELLDKEKVRAMLLKRIAVAKQRLAKAIEQDARAIERWRKRCSKKLAKAAFVAADRARWSRMLAGMQGRGRHIYASNVVRLSDAPSLAAPGARNQLRMLQARISHLDATSANVLRMSPAVLSHYLGDT